MCGFSCAELLDGIFEMCQEHTLETECLLLPLLLSCHLLQAISVLSSLVRRDVWNLVQLLEGKLV